MSMQTPYWSQPALPSATLRAPGFTTQFQANPAGFSLSNSVAPAPMPYPATYSYLPPISPPPACAPLFPSCQPTLAGAPASDLAGFEQILAFLQGMAFGQSPCGRQF
ncbi:MAG: hypothetical protein IPK79_05430 [Vampirovibrionales bacterium]|nr:hypothetical protein [Vampirovibrionales bacterium]